MSQMKRDAFIDQLLASTHENLMEALIEIRNEVIEHLRDCTCNESLCCIADVARNFAFMSDDMEAIMADEEINVERLERAAEKARSRNAEIAKIKEAKLAQTKQDE